MAEPPSEPSCVPLPAEACSRYGNSMAETFRAIVREEGVLGLWRGAGAVRALLYCCLPCCTATCSTAACPAVLLPPLLLSELLPQAPQSAGRRHWLLLK